MAYEEKQIELANLTTVFDPRTLEINFQGDVLTLKAGEKEMKMKLQPTKIITENRKDSLLSRLTVEFVVLDFLE